MRKHRLAAAVAVAFIGLAASGCDQKAQSSAQVKLDSPAEKASYGLGLNMGQNLLQEGIEGVDPKAVALGLEDALAKKKAQVSDKDLMAAFTALQTRAEEHRRQVAKTNAEEGKKFLEENGKKEGVVTTASGLQYQVLKKADGPQPKDTDLVTVNYEGKLIDGTVFDSSIKRGRPIDLPVDGVIPGWTEALKMMRVGEKYRIFIPANLAYGVQSPSPDIPPNSVLIFDLELLGIKDPKAAMAAPPKPASEPAAEQQTDEKPAEKK